MGSFADVEAFGRLHEGCGGLRPSATQGADGLRLTITCECGETLSRIVTPEEARQPLPLPRRRAPQPARSAAPAGDDFAAAIRAAEDAEAARVRSARAKPSARPMPRVPPPAKLEIDTTIETALMAQAQLEAEAEAASTPPVSPRAAAGLVVGGLLVLGAAAGLFLVMAWRSAPVTPAPPPPAQAAANDILQSLNGLRAVGAPHTSLPAYVSQVSSARADLERLMASSAPASVKDDARGVFEIYRLAGDAWTARVREDVALAEAVGEDPALAMCPALTPIVDGAPPTERSRAHARGVVVASSLSMLWECAAERLAALERQVRN